MMPTESEINSKPGQYLTFVLKSQTYGVPIGTVREINQLTDITAVPQAPKFVAGVMNLRGKVIPVVDLRLKFSLEAERPTKQTCIIVIEVQGGQIGMIVDQVRSVIDLTQQQIEPAPNLGEATRSGYVIGMGKVHAQEPEHNEVIILVDIVKALSKEEMLDLRNTVNHGSPVKTDSQEKS
jgi:purine-binding chemotaxis protein CheW